MLFWTRLMLGVIVVFALFQVTAAAWGSDRGQAGLAVGAVVVAAVVAVEWLAFRTRPAAAARSLGMGPPRAQGLLAAAVMCALILAVVPVFGWMSGTSLAIDPRTPVLLPGLFAQAGVAEEVLFRGYLFGHLRHGRTFWRAALLAMMPFAAVHLWLFATMDWPVAAAAVCLSLLVSLPLARLFELGGATIWPPALLHFVIQAVPKLLIVSGDDPLTFPLVWMAATATIPMLVFSWRGPTRSSSARGRA